MSHPFELELTELQAVFDSPSASLDVQESTITTSSSDNSSIPIDPTQAESEDSNVVTQALEEDGGNVTTLMLGEEGGDITTLMLGEEGGATTEVLGEDGGDFTSMALGEEGGATTDAVGEDGGVVTTMAVGEEGGTVTTLAVGEEGGEIPGDFMDSITGFGEPTNTTETNPELPVINEVISDSQLVTLGISEVNPPIDETQVELLVLGFPVSVEPTVPSVGGDGFL